MTEETQQCKGCNGLGTVPNDVNGINFDEECQRCKGTGRVKARKKKEGTLNG